jgi:hypothetical protein
MLGEVKYHRRERIRLRHRTPPTGVRAGIEPPSALKWGIGRTPVRLRTAVYDRVALDAMRHEPPPDG